MNIICLFHVRLPHDGGRGAPPIVGQGGWVHSVPGSYGRKSIILGEVEDREHRGTEKRHSFLEISYSHIKNTHFLIPY